MNNKLVFVALAFVPFIITGQAAMNDSVSVRKSILSELEQRKQRMFDAAFANQDTVKALIKKKPKTIVLEKIKYIKIYKTIPVYVPENEIGMYRSEVMSDTLESDFLTPSIEMPKPIVIHKKIKKFLGIF